jgi:hypothetical protein
MSLMDMPLSKSMALERLALLRDQLTDLLATNRQTERSDIKRVVAQIAECRAIVGPPPLIGMSPSPIPRCHTESRVRKPPNVLPAFEVHAGKRQ